MKISLFIVVPWVTFTLIIFTEKTCVAQNNIVRDSLIGKFAYSTRAYNTGLINLYDDSTCTITGIPGCYSCLVLNECGTWKIKRKHLLIESTKDTLIKSKLLKDSCVTIVNLAGNNGEIQIWKNGIWKMNNEWKNGIIKVPKMNFDSIYVLNFGFSRTIYNEIEQNDYYEFSMHYKCSTSGRVFYKFKILPNYSLKGKLSGQKVILFKKNNIPDIRRKLRY